MKVCPVCSEVFEDELRFCDIDGTRLVRQRAGLTAAAPRESKTWSLLGAGLLLGALVISAASIIFFPKARVSPVTVSSDPQPAATVSQPGQAQAPSAGETVASAPQDEVAEEELPPVEVKKKEKPVATGNENFNGAAPNPKAAALAAEEADATAKESEEPLPPPPPKRVELPAVKAPGEARETEAAPRPATNAESRRDPKRTSDSKDSDKNSNSKKKEEGKKKGGILRAFKKIFGG